MDNEKLDELAERAQVAAKNGDTREALKVADAVILEVIANVRTADDLSMDGVRELVFILAGAVHLLIARDLARIGL